jgi:hypothetical protein
VPPKVAKKRCARCRKSKPVKGWPPNAARADGLGIYCRQCKREADRGAPPPKPRWNRPASKAPPGGDAPKRKPGPASKLTPELVEQLCAVLRKGHTYRAACARSGIDDRTFRDWMAEGLEARTGPKWGLYLAVREAEGEGEASLTDIVRDAAEIDPQYAKWLLERRHPVDWARKEQIAVTGGEGKALEVSVVRELISKRIDGLLAARPATPPSGGAGGAGGPAPGGGAGAAIAEGAATPPPPAAPDAGGEAEPPGGAERS